MANAWDVADNQLLDQLDAYLIFLDDQGINWAMVLYQNDYTPVPGSDIPDFVECDVPGITAIGFNQADWLPPSVTTHVASSVLDHALVFTADASGFDFRTIYGYFIIDDNGLYVMAERFASPRIIYPSDTLEVTPVLRQGVIPAP